jgi:succinoglycan biosynthesis protein ExoM
MERLTVCICTFRRASVVDTIRSVRAQSLPPDVALRIVVADNDDTASARALVLATDGATHYLHAPSRNISVARNACLDAAGGGLVAFIDDDETAGRDWLAALHACLTETGVDAVFGPARAVYPPGTPEWLRLGDWHSNLPQRRGDTVETGHSCNVLMRWTAERFRPDLGRSGGEDTEFFFRLHRMGWRFAICDAAVVHEAVDPRRLRFGWLVERRFAEGRHYGAVSVGGMTTLVLRSIAKSGWCMLRSIIALGNRGRLAFWVLRGVFHLGVGWGAVVGVTGRRAYG